MSLTPEQKQQLCIQCQLCCRVIAIPTTYDFSDPLEGTALKAFWKARGFEIDQDILTKNWFLVHRNLPCPNLTPFGCKIYFKRPYSCKKYDGTKDTLVSAECLWSKYKE